MKYLVTDHKWKAEVQKIEWERIHLHIYLTLEKEGRTVSDTQKMRFYLVDKMLGMAMAELCILKYENGQYHLTTNITNQGNCACIPSGIYGLFISDGENTVAVAEYAYRIFGKLADYSRNFPYNGGQKVYTVNFGVKEGEDNLPFEMTILAAAKTNTNFPALVHLHDRIHPVNNIRATWLSSKNFLRRSYQFYYKKYKKKRAYTVLFLTEQNDQIASNLKAVMERMQQRGMEKEYTILTSARFGARGNHGFKSWLVLVKKLASSGIVFVDDHAPVLDWLKLSDDTKVVQLWHAGAGFKSSGYSRWGHPGCPAPQSAHRQYSYGISGSQNIAHFFSEVWGINEEQVLPTGMPRMDEYLNQERRVEVEQKLREKYMLCKEKKVILFAPTYRGRSKLTAYYPYELIDFEKLYELCGDEYVVFFKMHPWVPEAVPIPKQYQDKFVDVNKFPNINDLFYITDLLITDYSSNIFEYSLMKKPILFFAFDKLQYAYSRGFHRAYEESAPGKVVYTFEQLLAAIREHDFEFEKVEEYVNYSFDYIDCNASDRVIDWFVLGQLPKEFQNRINGVKEKYQEMQKLLFENPEYEIQEVTKGKQTEQMEDIK